MIRVLNHIFRKSWPSSFHTISNWPSMFLSMMYPLEAIGSAVGLSPSKNCKPACITTYWQINALQSGVGTGEVESNMPHVAFAWRASFNCVFLCFIPVRLRFSLEMGLSKNGPQKWLASLLKIVIIGWLVSPLMHPNQVTPVSETERPAGSATQLLPTDFPAHTLEGTPSGLSSWHRPVEDRCHGKAMMNSWSLTGARWWFSGPWWWF